MIDQNKTTRSQQHDILNKIVLFYMIIMAHTPFITIVKFACHALYVHVCLVLVVE